MRKAATVDFFLGALSPAGFTGWFAQAAAEDGQTAWLIKAGPGCGKSTLMRRLLDAAGDPPAGQYNERLHCSSDPASLDGVRLPGAAALFLDATAPHTLDCKYPGAAERVVSLYDALDNEALARQSGQILALGQRNADLMARAAAHWALACGLLARRRAEAADLLSTAVKPETDDAETIPLSSITYPNEGDRYATITIEGTEVNAPVYYGDNTTILNQGVGTYKDDSRAGIPGESKTILLAGHNNTFFNDLQSVEVGDVVTIETHYGTYTYTVEECKVLEYNDTSAYDFTRTDENLILYTCYPFDALGFTSQRYFVYASYTSGPMLDADN